MSESICNKCRWLPSGFNVFDCVRYPNARINTDEVNECDGYEPRVGEASGTCGTCAHYHDLKSGGTCGIDLQRIKPSTPACPHYREEEAEASIDESGVQNWQVGGDHYVRHAIQPWDAMREWMSAEEFKGFLRGNAIKYIARCTDKGGVEDVEKAIHYLQRLAVEMRG